MSSDIVTLFTALWNQTEEELARASVPPRPPKGTIAYRFKVGGLDAGEYAWNGGAPTIRLYRSGYLPEDLEEPDLLTQPMEDACFLAYQRGHFMADPTRSRSQSAYEVFRQGASLGAAQRAIILEAERRAWQNARWLLGRLGWTDWASFEAIQWRSLRGYSESSPRPTD